MTRVAGPDCAVMYNLMSTHTHAPWEDQSIWHRMTRMTGYYMQFNKYTYTHTRTHA